MSLLDLLQTALSILLEHRTEAEFREYIATNYMSGIDLASKDLDTLLKLYPADPAAGSPFNTGNANALTPQYKRNAALVGDITFQAPRRFFLEHRSHKQDTYAFCELT